MTRFRWFKIVTKGDAKTLERQITSKVFSLKEPVSSGFRIERKDTLGFSGQFIHKRTVEQKVLLPSGEEFVQEVAHIDITKFGIDFSSSKGLLYIIDAPRSTTPFFSAFSEATNFSCAFDPIEISVEQWISHLVEVGNDISVTYLDIVGINISDEIQARLAMAGQKNVDIAMHEFLPPGSGGRIESAKIRCTFNDSPSIVELGRRAILKIPAGFPIEGIEVLRKTMLLAKVEC